MFQKILVPLDGSMRAERALPVAARIARGTGGSLVFVRAIMAPSGSALSPSDPFLDLSHLLFEERIKAMSYLRDVTFMPELEGLKTSIEVLEGQPAYAILAAARDHQADVIVMCSHGERGFQRWMLGSVALQITRQSPVPVLVLRPDMDDAHAPFTGTSGPRRVLVPLDGSELAEQALMPAVHLARILSAPSAGAIHLVCVVPHESVDQELLVQSAQKYLAGIEQRFLESTVGKRLTLSTSVLVHVDVAQALVELAEAGKGEKDASGYDLIAMATHGRGGIVRWFMGSITQRVLDTTKMPLLMVRAHKAREHERRSAHTFREETETISSWMGLS